MYGPWYSGHYQALVAGLRTRTNGRYLFEATYIFAHAVDNLLNASLHSDVGAVDTIGGGPTDSFIGVPHGYCRPCDRSDECGRAVRGKQRPPGAAGRQVLTTARI